ncbi:hypothetical protein MNBD_ALPHA08-1337 [hydrothermal vent metagenome]|uniref:J domain-containing protein n=1 Tax=hydrothermal vent metagenome TaxID=652676 RepID=A0A3B0S3K3_9ZZZZ
MFNSENATKNIATKVKLMDGSVQTGNLIISMTSDLPRTLNGETKFLEFEDMSGERCFFAKHSLAQVTPTDIPKARKLDAGADSDENFNPYRVLKISPESDAAAIQAAYYQQAKLYHPDRFSGCELPDEMARYADNMSRLINAAFQAIGKPDVPAEAQPTTSGQAVNL